MSPAGNSRRGFCWRAAAIAVTGHAELRGLAAQIVAGPAATPTRPDVAAIDHDRIVAAAARYVTERPAPPATLVCPRNPGSLHDYYSEAESQAAGTADATPTASTGTQPFTAHRDALFALGLQVPALAAAHLLTGDGRFAERAMLHLRAWFIDPATRMTPRLDYGQSPIHGSSAAPGGSFTGILETLPLVEVAQAIPFLAASEAMSEADLAALHAWFAEYLRWLTEPQDSGPRLAALARDRKDHHGTSWMLQVSAYSLLTAPENGAPKTESKSMDDLRHRFRTVTLRAQITAEGKFPRELSSEMPYRNSLFNLDMLAAICNLLSTRFESVWDYELEDGPGVRGAIAYHFPYIARRNSWPFRADIAHFSELPGRRASLLLAARAYQRPEYAALWKMLSPDGPFAPEVLRTIPIQQPLLWVRQPPRAG